MTQTASRPAPEGAAQAPVRLLELLERGELDWDDPGHREAYLRAWVSGNLPPPPRTDSPGE